MEEKLIKPCPFCGRRDLLYLVKQFVVYESDYETEIFCNHCKIMFRRKDDFGNVEKNEEALIDFWNKGRDSMEEKELTPLEALEDLFDNANRKLSIDDDIDKLYIADNGEDYQIIKKTLEESERYLNELKRWGYPETPIHIREYKALKEENEELKKKDRAFDLIKEIIKNGDEMDEVMAFNTYEEYSTLRSWERELTKDEFYFVKKMLGGVVWKD